MIDPYKFISELTDQLQQGATVVCSNGTSCVTMFRAGIVKKDQRIFWNSGCTSMGWALPSSIGASFAKPDKQIICLEGDGSIMMSLQELQTIRQHNLPIKIFLFNNEGYHSLQETYDNFCDGKHYGSDLDDISFPNWRQIAFGFDLSYSKIEHSDILYQGIKEVLEYGSAILCEVVLGDYKFRKEEL